MKNTVNRFLAFWHFVFGGKTKNTIETQPAPKGFRALADLIKEEQLEADIRRQLINIRRREALRKKLN